MTKDGTDQDDRNTAFSSHNGDLELDIVAPRAKKASATLPPGQEPDRPEAARPEPVTIRPTSAAIRPMLRPLPPVEEKGSWVLRLFLLGLLAMGAYGGYFGYCKYKVSEKVDLFSQQVQDLQQALNRVNRTVRPEDMRRMVIEAAEKTQVKPEEIRIIIEPLGPESMKKLPQAARTALGIAAKIPHTRTPQWVVGFKARLLASHGIAKHTFEAERYTWFDDARP